MASAALTAGASILGGITSGKGAKKAAKIQAEAYKQGIAEERRQFDLTRQDNLPFLQGGQQALGATQTLLGLNGGDAQQAAIDALKASPGFTSLYNTGADTILQNAAATGGLRGGNTQNSLANFGAGLLGTVIQNQLSNLGGLVNIGAGTAGNLGQLGQANANAIADLLAKQGGANAAAAQVPYTTASNIIGSLGSLSGMFGGGGGGGLDINAIRNSGNYALENLKSGW